MNMIITTNTTANIDMDRFDQSVMKRTDKIFERIIDKFPRDSELLNLETGEVIEVSELARMRGILHFFFDSDEPISCKVL